MKLRDKIRRELREAWLFNVAIVKITLQIIAVICLVSAITVIFWIIF